VFFDQQTVGSIVAALERFDRHENQISPQACRANALRFSTERFRREFQGYVERQLVEFRERSGVEGWGRD
jgi:hypothetical protein